MENQSSKFSTNPAPNTQPMAFPLVPSASSLLVLLSVSGVYFFLIGPVVRSFTAAVLPVCSGTSSLSIT